MAINEGRLARRPDTRTLLSKVPEVTIFFWVIKVLCTTVGETCSASGPRSQASSSSPPSWPSSYT